MYVYLWIRPQHYLLPVTSWCLAGPTSDNAEWWLICTYILVYISTYVCMYVASYMSLASMKTILIIQDLLDPLCNLSVGASKLKRKVEMFQWDEKQEIRCLELRNTVYIPKATVVVQCLLYICTYAYVSNDAVSQLCVLRSLRLLLCMHGLLHICMYLRT